MHDTHYTWANIKGKEKLRTMTMITSCLEFLSSNQRIMLLECCCIKVSEGSSLLRDIKIIQFIHHNILMWKQHCVHECGSHEKHRLIFQAHYPKVLSFIWWWWWCDNRVTEFQKKKNQLLLTEKNVSSVGQGNLIICQQYQPFLKKSLFDIKTSPTHST